MQDMILSRIWTEHHQRIYGENGQRPPQAANQPALRMGDSLPIAGKLLAGVLALAMSYTTLGASVSLA